MAKGEPIAMHVSHTGNDNPQNIDLLEWSEAEEAAVRRKIDFRIVPLSILLYLLCVSVSTHPPSLLFHQAL